ncbi:MAG: hypothetical protein ACI8QT_000363 [Halioglobus sp.]|jgi:hypothetical protein
MSTLIPREQKNSNPQGKGCVPVLQDWAALRPQLAQKKSGEKILTDYCLSALVLGAKFRFRPVPGQRYYLYGNAQEWSLSLIAPQEWGEAMPGEFVADCQLQYDMTWKLRFCRFAVDSAVLRRLEVFVENFAQTLAAQKSVIDELPFYVSSLPYYQRMLATGLSASLHHSIKQTGQIALIQALPKLLI